MGEAGTWRANAHGWLGVMLILASGCGAMPARADDQLPTRVGRVSDFGGELYLAPQDRATDGAAIGVNYPVTSGDNLWVASDAPRGDRFRLGATACGRGHKPAGQHTHYPGTEAARRR